jgi:peptidoglycan/LPS O-acetylase OafA/YrhL
VVAAENRTAANRALTDRDRLEVLDAFRALAILGVVAVHFVPTWLVGPGGHLDWSSLNPFLRLLGYGGLGVQLFFMVSGFVIFMTLERCQHLFEFWWRRFARIYPAYVTAMALSVIISKLAGPANYRNSLREVLLSLTFMTPFVSGARFVDGVYWTLVVEMQFYLFVSLIYLIAARHFVAAWAVLVGAATTLWVAGGYSIHSTFGLIAGRVLIAPYLPLFSVGIAMYFFHRRRIASGVTLAVIAGIAFLMVSVGVPPITYIAHGLMVLAFVLFLGNRLGWLAVAPVLLLGNISYALYLTHLKIGNIVFLQLKAKLSWPDAVIALMASCCCLVLAFALYRLVEVPAKTAINRLGRRYFGTFVRVFPGFRFVASRPASGQ